MCKYIIFTFIASDINTDEKNAEYFYVSMNTNTISVCFYVMYLVVDRIEWIKKW